MNFWQWEAEVYPKIWAEAYEKGEEARKDGLPRECNLDEQFRHKGKVLSVWENVWEQGYDGRKAPSEFRQVEEALKQMPVRPLEPDDF